MSSPAKGLLPQRSGGGLRLARRRMAAAGSCSGSRSPRRTPTPLTTLQFHRSAPGSRRSASSPELQLYVSGCATEPGAATTATLLRPVPPTSSPPWLEKNHYHYEALESFSVVSQARQHGQSAAAAPGACRACRACRGCRGRRGCRGCRTPMPLGCRGAAGGGALAYPTASGRPGAARVAERCAAPLAAAAPPRAARARALRLCGPRTARGGGITP